MNRVKASRWGLLVMAAGACLASSPASAGDGKPTSRYESVERMSQAGRYGVGQVYRYSGERACGRACGRAAQQGGYYIYDRSREFANRNGERLQNVGRRTRERIEQRRRR